MKDSRTAVVYDLDGTLADNAHRRHLIPEDPTVNVGWEPWAMACADDTPIWGMITRMRLDYGQHQVHIVSSRDAVSYDLTAAWLNRTAGRCYEALTLREAGDERSALQLKVDYIRSLYARGIYVALAYEDIKHIAEGIWEQTGTPVVLVNPAYDWIEIAKAEVAR